MLCTPTLMITNEGCFLQSFCLATYLYNHTRPTQQLEMAKTSHKIFDILDAALFDVRMTRSLMSGLAQRSKTRLKMIERPIKSKKEGFTVHRSNIHTSAMKECEIIELDKCLMREINNSKAKWCKVFSYYKYIFFGQILPFWIEKPLFMWFMSCI